LLRRVVAAIVLVPLAIIIVAFAVANRHLVTVSFDPFGGGEPAASVTLPLFALIIVLLIIGVAIGGFASWLRHGKWRGAARRFERELGQLRGKLAALEGSAQKPSPETPNSPISGPFRLRPPSR